MVNGKWDLANGKPVDLSFSICHLPFAICDSRRRIVLQEPNVTPTSNCTQVPELICRATDCTHQKACHELHEFHETGQARPEGFYRRVRQHPLRDLYGKGRPEEIACQE